MQVKKKKKNWIVFSLQILGEKEKKDHYLIIMILIPGVHDFPKEPRPNRAPESLSVKNFVT